MKQDDEYMANIDRPWPVRRGSRELSGVHSQSVKETSKTEKDGCEERLAQPLFLETHIDGTMLPQKILGIRILKKKKIPKLTGSKVVQNQMPMYAQGDTPYVQ